MKQFVILQWSEEDLISLHINSPCGIFYDETRDSPKHSDGNKSRQPPRAQYKWQPHHIAHVERNTWICNNLWFFYSGLKKTLFSLLTDHPLSFLASMADYTSSMTKQTGRTKILWAYVDIIMGHWRPEYSTCLWPPPSVQSMWYLLLTIFVSFAMTK